MRIDSYLFLIGEAKSRTAAQTLIEEGKVFYEGKQVKKPSLLLPENPDGKLEVRAQGCPYVSRGGLKLEAALRHFSIDVSGLCVLDVGSSTGGFTDCLLQNGASKVYAVDSGKAQLVPSLAEDARVVLRESCNARYLKSEDFPEPIDMIVMDVSFISQTLLFPALSEILRKGGTMVTLIKPQFEVGRSGIGRGGIVRNQSLRDDAVRRVCADALNYNFQSEGLIPSPITGGDGNYEFLAYFKKND